MLGKKFDQSVKTIVVGDSGVGKTCLLNRYIRDKFDDKTPTTLGVEFMAKIVETEKHRIEFQLWDTAGQELFRAVTRGYYRGSAGAFIVFNLVDHDTFLSVSHWLQEIKETARKDCVCILIGNQSDRTSDRQVSQEEIDAFVSEHSLQYFETSAKTGENVTTAMMACLTQIEKLIEDGKLESSNVEENNIVFAEDDQSTNKSCC